MLGNKNICFGFFLPPSDFLYRLDFDREKGSGVLHSELHGVALQINRT
jgi:hypothetical protein